MHANVGHKIVVDARHTGDRVRQGEIVAIRGAGKAVHYRVRWADGHESVLFPGSDPRVEHPEATGDLRDPWTRTGEILLGARRGS